jgi:uncharacterized protein (TIRG00374 family)
MEMDYSPALSEGCAILPLMTSEPPSEPATVPRLQRWGRLLLKIGITGLALYFTWRLLAGMDWRQLESRMAQASWLWLTPAVLCLLARWAAWDQRFRLAAAHGIGISPTPVLGFFVLMASAALNLITPSARLIGGLMRARYFARSTSRSFGLLYGVVLFDQIAHHAVMTTATCVSLIAAALAAGRPELAAATLAVLVIAAVGLAVWLRRRGASEQNPLVRFLARRAAKAEGRMQRLYAHGHEAVGIFIRLLGDGRLFAKAFLLGIGYVILNVGAQWLICHALGEPVSLLVVFAGVSLGVAAGTLTGTPGGLGTTEAAMVASFTILGVDRVEAAAATLLYRGLHYATVLAVGLPALAVLEMRLAPEPAAAQE